MYKELKNVGTNNPNNPIKKTGYRAKQRILNRGISNAKKRHLMTLSHQLFVLKIS